MATGLPGLAEALLPTFLPQSRLGEFSGLNGEQQVKILLCLTSYLLDGSSKLSGRTKSLAIDQRKYRAEMDLVKLQANRIEAFMAENDEFSNTDPRKRKVYIEELTKMVEGLAQRVEMLVAAIYNNAKDGANEWSGTVYLQILSVLSCLGCVIGAYLAGGIKASIPLVVGTGLLAAVTGYKSYEGYTFEAKTDELLKDAESFRKKVQEDRAELQFQSLELKMNDAVVV